METIKLTDIAAKAGISQSYISLILSGDRRPSWPVSQLLEKTTGISAVAWIDGKVNRKFLEEHYNPGIANRRKYDRRASHGRRITNGAKGTSKIEE